MSRHTRRAKIEELAEELTVGAAMRLRCDGTEIHKVVRAVVDYLVQEYPSQDLYIPASVTYPVADIQRDIQGGMSVRRVCRKYRIARQTLYRLLEERAPAA